MEAPCSETCLPSAEDLQVHASSALVSAPWDNQDKYFNRIDGTCKHRGQEAP